MEFDVATQREDLATTGDAVSTTGIAGLTLAGDSDGSRKGRYGYTVDKLLAAQVVVTTVASSRRAQTSTATCAGPGAAEAGTVAS